MATMGDAVGRLAAAHRNRHAHHGALVRSHLQGRSEAQPHAGQHAPTGPAFPIASTPAGSHGADTESH